MNIVLRYLGQLGQLAGKDGEVLECVPGSVLDALLRDVAAGYGPEFQAIVLTDDGAFRPSLMILVNGVPADKQALPEVRENDEITFMAAIAGG